MYRIKFFILVSFLIVVSFIAYKSLYSYTAKTHPITSTSIERGKNLTYNICGQCHFNEKFKAFSGKQMTDFPGFLGIVYSSNLTHSETYGVLSKYNEEELTKLLKTGVAEDGRFLPFMLRPNLADEDVKDIILYLRSYDDPLVAVNYSSGQTDLNVLGKITMKYILKPLPFKQGVSLPPKDDMIANGRYLNDNIGCFHCHSAGFNTLNYLEPEQSKGYMAGGMKFKNEKGEKVYASNLTPDKETGIGKYTQFNFRKAVIEGIDPHGHKLHEPMHKYTHLTNEQADAIFAYLQTLQAVHNRIKKQDSHKPDHIADR